MLTDSLSEHRYTQIPEYVKVFAGIRVSTSISCRVDNASEFFVKFPVLRYSHLFIHLAPVVENGSKVWSSRMSTRSELKAAWKTVQVSANPDNWRVNNLIILVTFGFNTIVDLVCKSHTESWTDPKGRMPIVVDKLVASADLLVSKD